MSFRCGFVGIVGPTNAGKSTLLNALVGEKLSIVSPKPQTTYHGIRGIVNKPDFQMIFTDTPGLQNYSDEIPRLLNKVSDQHAQSCDLLVWVFDVGVGYLSQQIDQMSEKIAKLKDQGKSFCALNKIDLIDKKKLLPLIAQISERKLFADIIPISARKKNGTDRLVDLLAKSLPESVPLFPQDEITDRPAQFLVSELIREKIYEATREEIPYSSYVRIEEWDETGKVPLIRAVLHIDSSSRKKILIGKGGDKLKTVGIKARKDIEKLLGRQICLKLFVQVNEGWKNDRRLVQSYLELH